MNTEVRTNTEVIKLTSPFADIWIATDAGATVNYSYGGTRLVDYQTDDDEVNRLLMQLMLYESALKNRLINRALKRNISTSYKNDAPEGFLNSMVGGARCLIRPKNAEVASILSDPTHSSFLEKIRPIFQVIGTELNKREGTIKLTPDFGHFAGLSDILYEFTPHTLGINRQNGGCGGKTSYSSTGVIAALEKMHVNDDKNTPITLIGSAGAMGSDILQYLGHQGFKDIAVCDLAYEKELVHPPAHLLHLPSQNGRFTDACLARGGVIIATTVGQELENSHWQYIPRNSKFFLAHNLAVPVGQEGVLLLEKLSAREVLSLPGQMLTLGGALTSRLEWFWRLSQQEILFDKRLAHAIVREIVTFLFNEILALASDSKIIPYEAMLQYANISYQDA